MTSMAAANVRCLERRSEYARMRSVLEDEGTFKQVLQQNAMLEGNADDKALQIDERVARTY